MPEQDYLDQKAKYGIQDWGSVPKVIDGECFCGTCSPCRRATRAMDKEMGISTNWIKSTGVGVFDAAPAASGKPRMSADEKKKRANDRNKEHKKRMREERYAQRIMVDGYLFHPHPDVNHGTMYAYDVWGCKCDKCFSGKYPGRVR